MTEPRCAGVTREQLTLRRCGVKSVRESLVYLGESRLGHVISIASGCYIFALLLRQPTVRITSTTTRHLLARHLLRGWSQQDYAPHRFVIERDQIGGIRIDADATSAAKVYPSSKAATQASTALAS